MIKKVLLFTILICSVMLFTGCIPPFIDGGIAANDYFESKVKYTTYEIDAGEEDGFVESETDEQSFADFTDSIETNVLLRSYRSFVFPTKKEGVSLTGLAFMMQAEDDCIISLTSFYGEDSIGSDTVTLKANTKSTVYWSNLNIVLEKDKELKIIITNPLEIGTVKFRTDSYVFIGQEV